MILYLKTLTPVPSGRGLIGRWVLEFTLLHDYQLPYGWHTLRLGVYQVKSQVPEGALLVQKSNIKGWCLRYSVWLPIVRKYH